MGKGAAEEGAGQIQRAAPKAKARQKAARRAKAKAKAARGWRRPVAKAQAKSKGRGRAKEGRPSDTSFVLRIGSSTDK